MLYIILALLFVLMLGVTLYSYFRWREILALWTEESDELKSKFAELEIQKEDLKTKLDELEKYIHIPDIIEKSKKLKDEIDRRINQANLQSAQIIEKARDSARNVHRKEIDDAEFHLQQVQEETDKLNTDARQQCVNLIFDAEQEAAKIVSNARIKAETRIRSQSKVKESEELLESTISFCRDLKRNVEKKAEEVAGDAIKAKNQLDYYEKAAQAMKNVIEGYGDAYMNHMSSMLDDWAEEFAYDKAAANLRGSRERTKTMIKLRFAAVSDYVEVGRREFAINFVLDAFNGKVDSIIPRLKPGNYGTLVQEIKDAFILVNVNGKGFRNSRITDEYLESRLDELKWAHAVQEVRIRQQEEQRAIREQMRDEQKARKEIERAIKQARRDEERVEKALAQAKNEFEKASSEEKEKYLLKIQELEGKLSETEGYIKRTQSLAEQTKQGHVYIISNIGSFGENVYKIGLTRRLDVKDRVNELGDASVPFRFDIHASIENDDAPALEYAIHKKLLNYQINKVNRRKEFFKINLSEIQAALKDMNLDVKWTLKAEAAEYYESLRIEKQIAENADFRKKWTNEQLNLKFDNSFDEDLENETEDMVEVI